MMQKTLLRIAFAAWACAAAVTPAIAADPPAKGPPVPADAQPSRHGVVVETMVAGGYRYVRLNTAQGDQWIAGPDGVPIAVGATVTSSMGTMMANFESRTLKRTFDRIWFVSRLDVVEVPDGREHATAARVQIKAPLPSAAGAISVADVYARRAALAGKQVVVRGQVAKFTAGAQQRNWIHLQDGTGDSGRGTHDLTVTTQDMVAVGQTIVVRGIVAVDQDYGWGYKYAVMIEQASVSAE